MSEWSAEEWDRENREGLKAMEAKIMRGHLKLLGFLEIKDCPRCGNTGMLVTQTGENIGGGVIFPEPDSKYFSVVCNQLACERGAWETSEAEAISFWNEYRRR